MTSWCGLDPPTSRDGRWAWIPSATSRSRRPAIARVRAGIRRMRDRLLAEHLGMDVETIARGIERAGSLCALIDSRQTADRTLTPIEPVTDQAGRTLGDASRHRRSRRAHRLWCGGGAAGAARRRHRRTQSAATLDPARDRARRGGRVVVRDQRRPEFQTVRDTLAGTSSLPSALWIGTSAFLIAGLLLVPLELLTSLPRSCVRCACEARLVAAIGSLVLAVIGYAAGRAIGAAGVARWISRRSYRSAQATRRARCHRRDRAAAVERGQHRRDSPALRRRPRAVCHVHGGHRRSA